MDFAVFLIGTLLFAVGFVLLLFFLARKISLLIPFILMAAGVVICFIGLILSSPLTDQDRSALSPQYQGESAARQF